MKSARFTSQTMNAAAGHCPCTVSSVVAAASNTSTLSRSWWITASYARANIDQALLAIRGKRSGVKGSPTTLAVMAALERSSSNHGTVDGGGACRMRWGG
jgi:hypothetical protein